MEKKVVKKGGVGFFGFGSILAIVISWHAYQSILWAILHGVFSWFYVIYYALTRNDALDMLLVAFFFIQ